MSHMGWSLAAQRRRLGARGKPHSVALDCGIQHASQRLYSKGLDLGDPAAPVPIGMGCKVCEQCGLPAACLSADWQSHRRRQAAQTGGAAALRRTRWWRGGWEAAFEKCALLQNHRTPWSCPFLLWGRLGWGPAPERKPALSAACLAPGCKLAGIGRYAARLILFETRLRSRLEFMQKIPLTLTGRALIAIYSVASKTCPRSFP